MLLRENVLEYVFSAGMRDKCVVPADISHIGRMAFYNTTTQDIIFENPDITYHEDAFYGSEWIKKDAILMVGDTFYRCNLKEGTLEIPENTKRYDDHAFAFGDHPTTRHFDTIISKYPLSMARLRDICGESNYSIIKYVIHSVLPDEPINFGLIRQYMKKLRTLTIDDESDANPYMVQDGVVFTKDMAKIVYYPTGKRSKVYEIPASVKSIGAYAFAECLFLEKIVVPDSVVEIGEGAFMCCKKLHDVSIPDHFTEIPVKAFYGCSIGQFEFPKALNSIGDYAFGKCPMHQMCVPEGVEYIGQRAFDEMYLIKFELPSTLIRIGYQGFSKLESVRCYESTARGLMKSIGGCSQKCCPQITVFMCDGSEIQVQIPQNLPNTCVLKLEDVWNQQNFSPYQFNYLLFTSLTDKDEKIKFALNQYKAGDRDLYYNFLKRSSLNYAKRLLKNNEEDALVELLKEPLFTRNGLCKLLELATEKNMVGVIAYIMNAMKDVPDTASLVL